jgi:tetratricopeptide (TPR) repeat protein
MAQDQMSIIENDQQPSGHPSQFAARRVYCLCIDMIGSTQAGLNLTTPKFDRFNRSLVEQIQPHLKKLDLTNALLKFTGDGWLLLTDDEAQVPALCCLSTVMANRFKKEMSTLTGIAEDRIPSLRLAICSGRDLPVVLPDGRNDWVGDSACRANRTSGYCQSNQILLDGSVRDWVLREFEITELDISHLPSECRPKRDELPNAKFILGAIKTEVDTDSETPEFLVYTLKVLGRVKEATTASLRASKNLEREAEEMTLSGETDLQPLLIRGNRLLANSPDYPTSIKILEDFHEAGLKPDVVTYNTLISLAPNYDSAQDWFNRMLQEGIQPDVVTYSTIFSKDLSSKKADELLNWYWAQRYHPESPIDAAISAFRKAHMIDQALKLVFNYPHLRAAGRLIKDYPHTAIEYLKDTFKSQPDHPNSSYALGVALMELGKEQEARPYLKKR